MLHRRTPRFEPLEDRRLLALVTVNTLADTADLGDGSTSLREAVFAANLIDGPDTIEFAPSLTDGGPATIVLGLGELKITDDLTISGRGAELLTIDAGGNDPTPDENNGDGSRVFRIDDGNDATLIDVTLSGLTLTGGDVLLSGGAILSRENLTLMTSAVSGNVAVSDDGAVLSRGGGIIHSVGLLTVTNSSVAQNAADFGGGIYVEDGGLLVASSIVIGNLGQSGSGIYNTNGNAVVSRSSIRDNSAGAFSLGGGIYNSGDMRIEATTISGNSAAFGGGVFSRTDPAGPEATTIINSTISGNTALTRGGGVRNADGRTVIQHSTITGNQAPPDQGSGVASRGYATSRTEVGSAIIAGNSGSDVDFGTGNVNTFHSLGDNLIGIGNASAGFQAAGDKTQIADPRLGPLVDNGGPLLPDGSKPPIHALLAGSPALDAGNPTAAAGAGGVPLADQRGLPFSRVHGGRIDIGAFESQPNPLAGDYNFDGTVDVADYVQWRNTVGSLTDLRADGNGDGVIGEADRVVWMANFGRPAAAARTLAGNAIGAAESRHARPEVAAPEIATRGPRVVGSRLFSPRAISDNQTGDSLLATLMLFYATDYKRNEITPDALPTARHVDVDQAGSSLRVLDYVFDALGAATRL